MNGDILKPKVKDFLSPKNFRLFVVHLCSLLILLEEVFVQSKKEKDWESRKIIFFFAFGIREKKIKEINISSFKKVHGKFTSH